MIKTENREENQKNQHADERQNSGKKGEKQTDYSET